MKYLLAAAFAAFVSPAIALPASALLRAGGLVGLATLRKS